MGENQRNWATRKYIPTMGNPAVNSQKRYSQEQLIRNEISRY